MSRLLALGVSLSLLLAACGGSATLDDSTALWNDGFGPSIELDPIVPFLGGSLIGYGAVPPNNDESPVIYPVTLAESQVILSDGTPKGTHLLFAGALNATGRGPLAVEVGGFGYFIARDPKSETDGLYRSDGTAKGTSLIRAVEASAIGAIARGGTSAVCTVESIVREGALLQPVSCDLFDANGWIETKTMPVEVGVAFWGQQLIAFGDRLFLDMAQGAMELVYLDPFSKMTPVGTIALLDPVSTVDFIHSTSDAASSNEAGLLVNTVVNDPTGMFANALYLMSQDGALHEIARQFGRDGAPERWINYHATQRGEITYLNTVIASDFVETNGEVKAQQVTSTVSIIRASELTAEPYSAITQLSFPAGVAPEALEFVAETGDEVYAFGAERLYKIDERSITLVHTFNGYPESPISYFIPDGMGGGYLSYRTPPFEEGRGGFVWVAIAADGSVSPELRIGEGCIGDVGVVNASLYLLPDCSSRSPLFRLDGGTSSEINLAPAKETWYFNHIREIGGHPVAFYRRAEESSIAADLGYRVYLVALPTR